MHQFVNFLPMKIGHHCCRTESTYSTHNTVPKPYFEASDQVAALLKPTYAKRLKIEPATAKSIYIHNDKALENPQLGYAHLPEPMVV